MNNYCWRSPRTIVNSENHTEWPQLFRSKRLLHKNDCHATAVRSSEEKSSGMGSVWQESLDRREYPKLGEKILKRKHSCGQLQYATDSSSMEKMIVESEAKAMQRKVLKKPKRTDLICIDLQQALENQRCRRKSQTQDSAKMKIKIRELNLNVSVRNTIEKAKIKRISKLKQLILRERELKKQLNVCKRELFELEKIQAVTKEVSEIDFDKLKIIADPKIDVDFVRSMSTLTLFGTCHRKSNDKYPMEQILEPRPDITKKLEGLVIERKEEDDSDSANTNDNLDRRTSNAIDPVIIGKTLCLKICNETGETVESFTDLEQRDQPKNSRKFREYCTNMVTSALNESLEKFLIKVVKLQKKLYDRNNVKGRCKRRYYTGLKEVEKHIELKKIKFVVIAPDLEKIETEGGLDESVYKLIGTCRRYDVTFCFALSRRKLGYLTHRKGSVSCVGVANYSGTEEKLKDVLEDLLQARNEYRQLNGKLNKVIDLKKLITDPDLLLSENVNSLMRILASTS